MKLSRFFYIFNIAFLAIAIIVIIVSFFTLQKSWAATDEEEPPRIFNVKIEEVTATTSIITWETDKESDSLVNYGLDKNYGIARDPHFDKIKHVIVLDNLLPDTTYYFRITSSDENGNQGISSDFSFKTKPVEEPKEGKVELNAGEEGIDEIKGGSATEQQEAGEQGQENLGTTAQETMTEQELLQDVLEKISQIKSEKALEVIEENLQNIAEDVSTPLSIILDRADLEIGTDYVIIKWKTNKEANSIVAIAPDDYYDPESEDPYQWKEGDPDEMTLEHIVEINGLEPATLYHFQVSSKTTLGQEAKSPDNTFKTKSILPEIYNISITKIQEDSATINFTTNVPCSSIIEYTNLNTNESKLEGNSSFLTVHSIQLKNLVFDTYYSVVITVENEQNEKAVSDPLTFITTRDEVPPTISKVNTESTLYPGSDNKVQTIVSWETDEPGKCQLFYHRGIISVDEAESLPREDDFTTKHVQVVTNFLPSTVYKFWIICEDDAENSAKSEDFTMLTPSQEESIIDIIIKNFESTFGWVKKLKM